MKFNTGVLLFHSARLCSFQDHFFHIDLFDDETCSSSVNLATSPTGQSSWGAPWSLGLPWVSSHRTVFPGLLWTLLPFWRPHLTPLHPPTFYLPGHRFEDVPGVRRHLVRKSTKGQVVHMGKDHKEPTTRSRKQDRTPHEVRPNTGGTTEAGGSASRRGSALIVY